LTLTVRNAAEEGFENLDEPKIIQTTKGPVTVSEADRLGEMMKLADLAEIYVKGVRAAVESSLLASKPVTGYKLVQGRKGARQWVDEKTIEEVLKKKRVKHEEMYTYKLITPAKAEKKWAKEKPTWWKELSEEGRISQSSGSISVAPTEDPRPAYTVEPQESGFEESVEDLF
jgi:transposase-like protein